MSAAAKSSSTTGSGSGTETGGGIGGSVEMVWVTGGAGRTGGDAGAEDQAGAGAAAGAGAGGAYGTGAAYGAGAGAGAGAGFADPERASSSFTFAINACGSKGLARNPSQPTRAARSWSNGSKAPVSSSTGMCDSAGFFLMKSQTSYPSFSGMMMSQ